MPSTPRARFVNPRLGIYFSIFASLFAGLFLVVLILEELGASSVALRAAMLGAPLMLYVAIGLGAPAREPREFFASGRRVPAVYAGLALAMTALGGTGLVALAGIFFAAGFDALCLVTGGLAGFVVMGVLLAPFLRKYGAFTIPAYLGRRFDSPVLRLASAALFAAPVLLMLTAEIKIGAGAAAALGGGAPELVMIALCAATVVAAVGLGGMRAAAWSGAAKLIAGLMALMAPVATIAVLKTNLPLPQLTTGPLLRALTRREAAQGFDGAAAPVFQFDLPGEGFVVAAKPFATAFGAIGSGAFLLATFSVMAGVAAAPWLLPRLATTPGVYEARKSLGWATFFFGVVMLTLAAIGIFMRDAVMELAQAGGGPPWWLGHLQALGFAAVDTSVSSHAMTSVGFPRDKVLFSLPSAAGMPDAMLYLALAGGLAVALAGAASAAVALAGIAAEDIAAGLARAPAPPESRIFMARAALLGAVAAGAILAAISSADPLKLLLWALALTGSSAFPVLVLSIWWKGLNAFGALAGLASGFAVAMIAIFAHELGLVALHGGLAPAFGAPAAALAAVLVSLTTPAPSAETLDLLGDIRVAGGETIHDREARIRQTVRA